jgi:hypothetical protein
LTGTRFLGELGLHSRKNTVPWSNLIIPSELG